MNNSISIGFVENRDAEFPDLHVEAHGPEVMVWTLVTDAWRFKHEVDVRDVLGRLLPHDWRWEMERDPMRGGDRFVGTLSLIGRFPYEFIEVQETGVIEGQEGG